MLRACRAAVTALLLGLILDSAAGAQSVQPPESLLIGPGDELRITVFAAPELNQETKVSDSGDIKLTLGGEVHVGGATPMKAGQIIEGVLHQKNYILVPQVAVTILRYATQTVSVFGSVKKPAAYPLDTPRSIIDVLAASGGLAEESSRTVVIRRNRTGEKIRYFLSESVDKALDNAPTVYPGDEVFVPLADRYYMIGDFNRPGAFANSTGQAVVTVLQMLALAGSTPPTAVPSRARLIRKKPDGSFTVTNLNISDIQKGKEPDVPLEPNDVIYIPFSYMKNIAVGIGSIVSAAASASVYKF